MGVPGMSYYEMALDAGYRGEEARQYAEAIERAEYEAYERHHYEEEMARQRGEELRLLLDDDGKSLYGRCGHCQRTVDNRDKLHRVTSIVRGGQGVECVLRGDIEASQAGPLQEAPF